MPALHDDLSNIARSIVLGLNPSLDTQVLCPKYPVATALAVYRNNYWGNLHDMLAYVYPVIEQLVGKEFFRYLTQQYIAQHPSASGNLHHYGAEMAGFIAAFEPAQGLVYLPDVAKLEWACHRAYFADDVAKLDVSRLSKIQSVNYPNLILQIDPACYLVSSSYPITTIWNAHQPGANYDFHISLESGPSNALVTRQLSTVIVSEMAEAEAIWMQKILSGVSLGKATAVALECHTDFDLSAALKNLVALETLTDFTFENAP